MKISVKPKTNIVRVYKYTKTIQWITAKGDVLYIEEMADQHLNNAINLLARSNSKEKGIEIFAETD